MIEKFNEGSITGGALEKDAILFMEGTHRGKTYTRQDLQALANSFNKADNVPVQLDHSESAKDTVGFLESVSVQGGQLLGKLRIIDEKVKERVDKGLMKKVSVSFYTDTTGKPTRLREVSLVAFPKVKGAELFSESLSEDEQFYRNYVAGLGIGSRGRKL
ncbi:TPA: hypothetical protein QCU10_004264 [Bacillus anthracis]|nr:hypothetical protein [Bacillus cereus biovar anthracis]HDR6234363.1 hypothetical protein [Bacillus cereus biovar anthracis]HDR6240559.1 hypothetical protein [Bacillus cereus biovar anthracis]HDR6252283.1 hypothetical protein [Bacillus cereus biovar anthracis]